MQILRTMAAILGSVQDAAETLNQAVGRSTEEKRQVAVTCVHRTTRQSVFRELYDKAYAELKGQLWVRGRKAKGPGCWGGGATRSGARSLARRMARAEMRRLRSISD